MQGLRLSVLGAIALLGAWTAAAAAPARPTNPPAPRANTAAAARAWFDAYIVPDNYILAGLQPEYGAILFDPASVAIQDGYVSAVVRGELFKSERAPGVQQRSYRDRWLFDCAAKSSKEAFSEGFPQSNLQGAPVQIDVSNHDWVSFEAGSAETRLVAQVCSLGSLVRAGVDRAKAMPPDSLDVTEAGTAAWLNSHIDAGTEKLVYASTGVGIYFDPAKVERTESGRPKFWRHTELTALLPSEETAWRSMREEIELDCLGYRYLRTKQEIYPGANLLGDAIRHDTSDEGWTEAAAGTNDGRALTAMCEAIAGRATAEAPAPARHDAAGLRDWIKAYVNTNRYVLMSATDKSAMFYGADDIEAGEQGRLLANLRIEEFDPLGGGDPSRSGLERAELDCRSGRYRVIQGVLYAGLNLTGAATASRPVDWTKPPAGTIAAGFVTIICAQASLVDEDPLLAIPTPLDEPTEQNVEAWVADHIDAEDYEAAGYDDDSVALYSTKELERTRQDYIRIWTRVEMFRPTLDGNRVVRSMRMLVEFDCAEHRSRTLASEIYPGSNLTGTKTEEKAAEAEWSFISPQSLLSYVANDVCDLKDAADEEAADPAKALPSSMGRQAL